MSKCLIGNHNKVMVADLPLEKQNLSDGEVQLKVLAATICEADRRFVSGEKVVGTSSEAALTLGHEAVGQVVCSRSDKVNPGDIVVVKPHIIPAHQQHTDAYKAGRIFQLETLHAGMDVHGTFAEHMIWPGDNLRPLTSEDIDQLMNAFDGSEHDWMLTLAESEHLACVMTALDHAIAADASWNQDNFERAANGDCTILIAGAGWLGWIWYLHLTARFPSARVYIRDVNESRIEIFRRLARKATGAVPEFVVPIDLEGEFDISITATSSRRSPPELFGLTKAGGHIILFSGIENGAVDPVFDPTGAINLEVIHRNGLHTMAYRGFPAYENNRLVVSGTSGYTDAHFDDAVASMYRYGPAIASGITGIVYGLTSRAMQPVRTGLPGLETDGAVLESLVGENWLGRDSHLKIGLYPAVEPVRLAPVKPAAFGLRKCRQAASS